MIVNQHRQSIAGVNRRGIVRGDEDNKHKQLTLKQFIAKRDFVGAITLLQFQKLSQTNDNEAVTLNADSWQAYCAVHAGEYRKALEIYRKQATKRGADPKLHLHAAICLFYLGEFTEAIDETSLGPECALQNRIRFHCAHRMGDESALMTYHQKLSDCTEDQLSLACIHFVRSHFQEATDIYKRVLIDNRDMIALQVYLALCYYRLDYYDVSLEIIAPYIAKFPDSTIALNLKACNHFRLYDGKAAETELKSLIETMASSSHSSFDNKLVQHNVVVFREGENALKVLPALVQVLPEARMNLVIYYLKQDEIDEAFKLMESTEPSTPIEYILKGVTHTAYGQLHDSKQHIKMAQQFFQLVGASASECDTIPGRQSMASCFYLLKQFDDVLIYLDSIKTYFFNDDTFRQNYGIALAISNRFKDAIDELTAIQNERRRSSYIVTSWLARCHIATARPWLAWELYLNVETSTDSFNLLLLIANDCYKLGAFVYAAKAFDVLWRLDASAEYWEGKRGACCGVLQSVIAGKDKIEHLIEVLQMLQHNAETPQAEFIIRIIQKYLSEHELLK